VDDYEKGKCFIVTGNKTSEKIYYRRTWL